MSFVATAVIGAGVLGAGATIYGASKAADAQTSAANTAANTQLSMYNTTNSNLAPYRAIGGQAATQLSGSLASLTSPITMDESTLENTPGYQFNLTQGLKATQNSAAARGLGTSGAALKGASTFATGLADSTYQNQFSNAVTNQTNAFNRLSTLVNTGENAGAQTGAAGTAAASGAAGAQIGAGNAAAAASNATGGALSGLSNNVGGYALAKGLYGGNVGSMPATGPGSPNDAVSSAYAATQGIF
jgi:hypothetical protein